MTRVKHPIRSAFLVFALGWIVVAAVRSATADSAPPRPSPERVKELRVLLNKVDQLELCYFERHKRFSDNPAELTKFSRDTSKDVIDGSNPLVTASIADLRLDLYVSDDGQAYTQRILGEDLHSTFERDWDNEFADYGEFAYGHVTDTCAR